MILYGSSMSPFVRKVIAYASEKGLEIEVRPVGIADQNPDFRAASPFGKMPALVDGDFRLADSTAIIHYLEAKHPEPALIPSDPELRGRCIWFEEFADTLLAGCGAKMFYNRVVAPVFLKREGDLAAAEAAERDELPKVLDYVESVAPEGEGWLVGDRLTLADLAVVGSDRNIFEPASLGKPILYFGDRKAWRNNRDALDALEKENGAMSFPRVRLRAVLDDSSRIQEMGASAARAYRQSKEQRIPEMTEKIVDCLLPFVLFRALYGMKEPLPQEAAPQDAIAPAVFGQAA